MKKLTLLLATLVLVLLCGSTAYATDISFSGGVKVTQGGTLGSPSVNFSFNGLTITPGTMNGDALEGASVSITPDSLFAFTSMSGDVGLFSPNHGTMTIGNATTGILTGDIDFVLITQGGLPGSFAIEVVLSNIVITGGTSNYLSAAAGVTNGQGVLTFQFTAPSGTQLSDLLKMGLGVGTLGSVSTINTSVSGSVAVPEPASLMLLGTGMLMGGSFVRRRFLRG